MLATIALSAAGFLSPLWTEGAVANDSSIDVLSVSSIMGDHCKSTRLRRVEAILRNIATSLPLQKYHCICRGLTRAETIEDARRFQSGAGIDRRLLGGDDIVLAQPYRFAQQWPVGNDPRTSEIIIWAITAGKNRVLTELWIGHQGRHGSQELFDGYLIPNDILELAGGSCSA